MPSQATHLYWLILGCEVAFWVVLALGLAARYVLRRERLSRILLLSLPGLDLMLVVLTAADLKAGAAATFAHGLATAYVGFTVAFASIAVQWADQHFAHWFASGPPPARPPARGWPVVRYDLELWLRCIVAWVITLVLLGALISYIGNEALTEPLTIWYRIAFGCVFFWFIFGPLWSAVFLLKEPRDA